MANNLQQEGLTSLDAPLGKRVASALSRRILRINGPCRVILVGLTSAPLVEALLNQACMVELAVLEQSALADMPAGVRAHVGADAWAEGFRSSDMVVASIEMQGRALDIPAHLLVLVARDLEPFPADLLEQASAHGWTLHTSVWTVADSSGEGFRSIAFSRCGVGLPTREAALQANLFALGAALVRVGEDVLVHAQHCGDAWKIFRQQSRCGWLGLAGSYPDHDVDQCEYASSSMEAAAGRELGMLLLSNVSASDELAADRLIAQADAAMKRGGRLVVELGTIDQSLLHGMELRLEEHGFLLDRAWMLRGEATSAIPMERVEVDLKQPLESQWADDGILVILAVKIGASSMVRTAPTDVPNILAFERDYDDPRVVDLIVLRGDRIASASARQRVALQILETASMHSADQGAAICVLLYDIEAVEQERREQILSLAEAYLEAQAKNPTVLRWQVSIAFVIARLEQGAARPAAAIAAYERVLSLDVLEFSPLLATKTVSAALSLGWLKFANGEVGPARGAWRRCVEEARRVALHGEWSEVLGDIEFPETFGLPEFAAVFDEASSAAAALRLSAEAPLRAGLAWDWANRSYLRQITDLHSSVEHQAAWNRELQAGKDWLDGQYRNLTTEVARLTADRSDLSDKNEGLYAAYRLAHSQAEEELERQRQVNIDVLAAYRLAHERAERRHALQKDRYGDLLATYRLSHQDGRRRVSAVYQELEDLRDRHCTLEKKYQEDIQRYADLLVHERASMDGLAAQKHRNYLGLLGAYHLAHRDAMSERVRYLDLVSAYGLASSRASHEIQRLECLLIEARSELAVLRKGLKVADEQQAGGPHERVALAADALVRVVRGSLHGRAVMGADSVAIATDLERITSVVERIPGRRALGSVVLGLYRFARMIFRAPRGEDR